MWSVGVVKGVTAMATITVYILMYLAVPVLMFLFRSITSHRRVFEKNNDGCYEASKQLLSGLVPQ